MSLLNLSVVSYAKNLSLLDLVKAYDENPVIKDALDKCDYFEKEAWLRPKQQILEVLNCEDYPLFLFERANWDKILDKHFPDCEEKTIPRRLCYMPDQMSKTEKYNFCVRMFRANWYIGNFQIDIDKNEIKMLYIDQTRVPDKLEEQEHLFRDVLCKHILYFCDYENPSFPRIKMNREQRLKKMEKTHALVSYNLSYGKLMIMYVGDLDSCYDFFENILFLLCDLDEVYGVGEKQGWEDLCAGKTYHHRDNTKSNDLMLLIRLPRTNN